MQDGLSLRERQRREALGVVHHVAVELVDESGLTGTTVEAIIERAGISRRTFFNYYATKEDAVLGTVAPNVPEPALSAFLDTASGDQFTRTLRLISAVMQTTRNVERVEPQEIRGLVERFPELRARLLQHMAAAERLIEDVLTDQFSRTSADSVQAADSARALLLLGTAVMRFAYFRDPTILTAPDRPAIREAIAVFREALDEVDLS